MASRTIFGPLRRVFRSDGVRPFDVHLAQLSVLYEDLRIETSGILTPSLPDLDWLNPLAESADEPQKVGAYRRHYFLRRSIATIREFAECLGDLRECPEFEIVRVQGSPFAQALDEAVQFFSDNERLLREARNNTGAHFGYSSAEYAIRNLSPDAIGKLSFDMEDHTTNALLHFSGELAATAFCRHLPGKTNEEKITNAIQRVAESYQHATSLVQALLAADLMHRFGK
jgi:hypothetical protein